MMQQEVGNFDFDKYYPPGTGDIRFFKPEDTPTVILEKDESVQDMINITAKLYSHRALNFVIVHYKYLAEDVNPNLIMRFDVRQINDIVTFRMSDTKREHYFVAACGDGYLRVFNAA